MGDYLDTLKTRRLGTVNSLLKLKNELAARKHEHLMGINRRKNREYHMGQETGWQKPSGVKYLENLHQVIIPDLINRIYSTNNELDRLTSEIESLEPAAVPVAEDVEGNEGDGKRRRKSRRRKSRRRKSRRRKSRRERTRKHHSTRRKRRKSRKYN